MQIYQEFLAKLNDEKLIAVCEALREKMLEFSQIKILKKFNLPFFYGKTWICYFNLVQKKVKGATIAEIELCFVRGRELPSKELLNFKKRTMIGGLSFKKSSDIDWGIVQLLLEEAITLDAEKPYTFTKKKK